MTRKEKNSMKKAMKAERKQNKPVIIKGNKYEKNLTPKSRKEAGVKIERENDTIHSYSPTQETQLTCGQQQLHNQTEREHNENRTAFNLKVKLFYSTKLSKQISVRYSRELELSEIVWTFFYKDTRAQFFSTNYLF